MGKKCFWLFPVIAMLGFLLTQCSTSKVDPYKNTLNADQIIMTGGLNNSGTRDQAQSLYADALNNIGSGDPNYDFIYSHANFGLAMIGAWNALATASGLISSNMFGSLSGGSATSSCQPIDLTPYQSLLVPVIDNMFSPIVTHLQAVTQFTGFSFTINSANLVILSDLGMLSSTLKGQGLSLDMSGAYDLGEVDFMLSLFETLQGGVKLLFAYNGVANTLINLALGLVQTGCTMSNPLTDPNFGTFTSNGPQMISDAQYILADGAQNLSNSMSAIMARKGDNSSHVVINYVDQNSNNKYDPGEPWGSEVAGQLVDIVLVNLLPVISPSLYASFASNPEFKVLINTLKGMTQKKAGQFLSDVLFAQGLPGGIPIPLSTSLTITLPAISSLIYLTDLQGVSNALHASIIDTNGQRPLDIIPAIPVLLPRLNPLLTPLLANLATNSTIGPLIGMLPTLEAAMFDNTGDAYTSLPILPSIDLGAFLSNPPPDLKALAPLSYQQTDPLVGTSTYAAPEIFADGFVHVPANQDPNRAGYWTSTASFVPGTDGSASGTGNVISGTVNGTCDMATIITDSTTGTPLTYTITGPCTGDPTSLSYSGEWYQDSGDHTWHTGVQVCNNAQSNTPCFVDLYGDGKYHQTGDTIVQSDEEPAFPLQTQPFTGLSFSGITMSAYSDIGTDRTVDNFELGYNFTTNSDPYGDDITCNTLSQLPPILPGLTAYVTWPIPNIPPLPGEAVCGEKNGTPDMWDNSLFSLLYSGIYISLFGINLGVLTPLGPMLSSGSTPFFPRYHYWPGSTVIDPPKLVMINLTETTFFQLINAVTPTTAASVQPLLPSNSLDSLAIALPNDTYMFFPDPSFGGLLTIGQFTWCDKYTNYIGIPYNASAPCNAISYSTINMTNAQFNQYVNIVNILIGVLNGTIKLDLSALGL